MSATNSTTHYSLPSFLGSDKPAWLVDWNGAMASIDSAIYEAKSTADSAVTAAAAVASDLATLSGTVSTQGSSITTLSETLTTAVGNINTINGNINTINSLIGNGTPTTTDHTLIGAINELHANVPGKIKYGALSNVTPDSNGAIEINDFDYAHHIIIGGYITDGPTGVILPSRTANDVKLYALNGNSMAKITTEIGGIVYFYYEI